VKPVEKKGRSTTSSRSTDDEAEDDAARNSRMNRLMQGVARQVSLDPGDGMEL
jgi:type IV secretion system protein VirD4